MKFFSLLKGDRLLNAPGKKVIPAEEISTLLSAQEVLIQAQKEAADLKEETLKECEALKEKAKEEGFNEGLKSWNEQLKLLEQKRGEVKSEMEKSIVPLAVASVRKIIGREIELKPETIVEMIATALKSVSHHKKIALFVNKGDLDVVEKEKGRLKALFEHLQSLTIAAREDVKPYECVIETEAGIMKVSLEDQLKALEGAFHHLLGEKA